MSHMSEMSDMTLYPLRDHLEALNDTVDMCQTDEERVACEAEIDRAIEFYLRKVDNVNRFFSHLESQIELAEKEIKRIKALQTGFVNAHARLEQYIIRGMQARNLRKMEGDTSRLTLRENTPALEVDDETAVPEKFKTIIETVKIDKMAVKAAIKSGEDVAGAHLREPTISLIRR